MEIINNYTKRQKKIIYYPNSFKEPNLKIILKSNHRDLLKKNYCITFAGNIGRAQNLESLLLASKNLEKLNKLKILILGEGSDKIIFSSKRNSSPITK